MCFNHHLSKYKSKVVINKLCLHGLYADSECNAVFSHCLIMNSLGLVDD